MKRFMVVAAALALLACWPGRASAGLMIYGTAYNGPNGPASLYTLDPTTGTATIVGPTGFNQVGALDFDPVSGRLFGVGQSAVTGREVLITINPLTGIGTQVGELGGNTTMFQDISFRNSDGTLYGYSSGNIYTINTTTGAATLVGPTGQGGTTHGNALGFSPGDTLFTVNETYIGTVNQTTGLVTPGPPMSYPNPPPDFSRANGMDFDNSTGVLWASVVSRSIETGHETNYLTTIDPTTGNVTLIGQTVAGLDAIAVQDTMATPAPPSAVLAASAALTGLGYWLRRRKGATA